MLLSFKILLFRSLLTFVATETGTLSYELLLRYLTLCVSSGHDAEVFDVYDIIPGKFPLSGHRSFQSFYQSLQPDSEVEGGSQHPAGAQESKQFFFRRKLNL